LALLTSLRQALPFVAARVPEGSDYIKVIVDVPGLSPDILQAVVVRSPRLRQSTSSAGNSTD